ncbi:MAG: Ig-like domain-containing protein [Chloroflexota bacterium]
MYGPGVVLPGQVITYTIEYENVGEGTAYGVHVESRLPDGLDEDTLVVQDGGMYLNGSRALLWDVGALGPGEGGAVHFQVQAPADAVSETIYIANAVVYFPSVPEVTPTNDVVTFVGEVIGYDQSVATDEGAPVAITLTGDSPSGNPLQFSITRQPGGGELSGSAPNLTYTPADNFEGADWFEFTVSDGEATSRPAVVNILVNTGLETIPPQILATTPSDGARGVQVYDDPLFGNVYAPAILAYTSEPMDSASLAAGAVSLVDDAGHTLDIEVTYNDYLQAIQLVLHEPLVRGRLYTVTITSAVRDTSGNPLAADYVWHFDTGLFRLYLPMVVRYD